MSKVCPICKKIFESKNKKKIYCSKECAGKNDYIKYGKAAATRFRKNKPERFQAIQKKYNLTHPDHAKLMKQKWRLKALNHISNKLECARCGFLDYRALQIDHINGYGRKEIREIGNGPRDYQMRYWKHILDFSKEEARKHYQILCSNCNTLKLFQENEFMKRDKK